MSPREKKYHDPLGMDFDQALNLIAGENRPSTRTIFARPFLKWVGGKRSILPELLKRMPSNFDVYHEPFMGGGALFFSVQPQEAYLSDVNFHLVLTFKAVRDDVDGVIRQLKIHERLHNKEYYLKARQKLFKEKDTTKLSALFIYLNKTCFNGLYRVNKGGGFNVPMGDYKDPNILDEENLRNASLVLKNADIEQHSFDHTKIIKGDFYYLDPPYHETYSGYDGLGFGDEEHQKLAEFCRKIDARGGFFMLSNSDTPFVRQLYKGYYIETVQASRNVSCKAHQRGKENELIIRNYNDNRGRTS
ncbi:MAG: DNA adenine methylase [Candidatus Paceibacterota bacterium]